jgi:hypothetical protein
MLSSIKRDSVSYRQSDGSNRPVFRKATATLAEQLSEFSEANNCKNPLYR